MYSKNGLERIHQGDLLEQIEYKFLTFKNDEMIIDRFTFPYAVVLSQECDLEQDYEARKNIPDKNGKCNQDKYLNSLLICPAYLAAEFRGGIHLNKLGYKMEEWTTDQWKIIKSNHNDRFHFLDEDTENGLPNLIIDFKHFYTLTRDEIYQVFPINYKISLKELFRERLSQRFVNYLSRIGLPVRSENLVSPTSVPVQQD